MSKKDEETKAPNGPWVYEKVGVSLPLGADFEGFVKVEFGHAQMAASDSPKDLKDATRKVQAYNDEQIAKRVKQLKKALKGK